MTSSEDANNIMIEEELMAHYWLRRFVLVAPWMTAMLYLANTFTWLNSSGFLIYSLFLFLVILAQWSYIKTSYTSPGKIPPNWDPPKGCTYIFPEHETGLIPQYRHCDICNNGKPPRSAHCKYCRSCVPKMDHHCAWTANCVGEKNHKYFILFVFYTFLYSLMGIITILSRIFVMAANSENENHPAHFSSGHVMITIILLIAATPACVGTLSLLVTQYYAVFYNITTLEQFSCRRLKQYALEIGDTEWSFVYPYDQGKYNNFLDIFGSKPLHWFFPIVENQEQLKSWPINKNHRQPKHYESV